MKKVLIISVIAYIVTIILIGYSSNSGIKLGESGNITKLPSTGATLSGGATSSLVYWSSPTTIGATSSPVVGSIIATSTTERSTFNIATITNASTTALTSLDGTYLSTVSGGVRIGSAVNPTKMLDVTGTVGISATTTIVGNLIMNNFTTTNSKISLGQSTANNQNSRIALFENSSIGDYFYGIGLITTGGSSGGLGLWGGTEASSPFNGTTGVTAHMFIHRNDGNVGIATTTAGSKLTVASGDVFVTDSTRGIILKSPDGTCARGTISNLDVLSFTSVTCPQ